MAIWESKTVGRFDKSVMGIIQDAALPDLIEILCDEKPLMALRALAEVMLSGQDPSRLRSLLSDSTLSRHWREYDQDPQVTASDRGYAAQLDRLSA